MQRVYAAAPVVNEQRQYLVKEPAQYLGKTVRPWTPSPTSSVNFKAVYAGFVTARRLEVVQTREEGEQYSSVEATELLWTAPVSALPPRRVSVTLVLPVVNHGLVDAFATLAETKTASCAPMATVIRLAIVTGAAVTAYAPDSGASSLVVRCAKDGGVHTATCSTKATSPRDLQKELLSLGQKAGVELPTDLLRSPPDEPSTLIEVVERAAEEFHALLNVNVPFLPSDSMRSAGLGCLELLDGVLVRLTPKNTATDAGAIHGFFLCRDGKQAKAKEFVTAFGAGLPPEHQTAFGGIQAHVAASHDEPLLLNAMVSAFGTGAPGATFSAHGALLVKTTTTIACLSDLVAHFDVQPCTLEDAVPGLTALVLAADRRLQRSLRLVNRTFSGRVLALAPCASSSSSLSTLGLEVDADDRAIAAALGLDLCCTRTRLGDALSVLPAGTAKTALARAAATLGPDARLPEAFELFQSSMDAATVGVATHKVERARLKRAAALALAVPPKAARLETEGDEMHTAAVKRLLLAHGLVAHRRQCKLGAAPRPELEAKQFATAIKKALGMSSWKCEDEVVAIGASVEDPIVALGRATAVALDGHKSVVFALVRPAGGASVCYRIVGVPARCALSAILMEDAPRVFVCKQADKFTIIPMCHAKKPPMPSTLPKLLPDMTVVVHQPLLSRRKDEKARARGRGRGRGRGRKSTTS